MKDLSFTHFLLIMDSATSAKSLPPQPLLNTTGFNSKGRSPLICEPSAEVRSLTISMCRTQERSKIWRRRYQSPMFLGINAIDYSGYPDCRPEYLEAYERMANLATKASVQDGRSFHIHAPLIQMNKALIIQKGVELGVPYGLTWSCYEGGELACGTCDSCLLRLNGFAEAGMRDPIGYI